ncbi:MAG: alpha-L-fucosidase [Bacteroidales bacterium]|nr:alpha-L-fucosidase [Bacteroidales bacterium]
MKVKYCILAVLLFATCCVNAQNVEPTWESINQRGYPKWFNDAKLGIFVHWGLYSVPAYASKEGYGEWLYRGLMTNEPGRVKIMKNYVPDNNPAFGSPTLQQYAGLRNYWNAELWNPEEWARLFEAAGAKYVMLVTKHHDGYCLWDYPNTALPEWNSVASGPKRDIVKELTTSVKRHRMKMCFYYSLTEWTNPIHTWMVSPDDQIDTYVDEYMIPQIQDLVTKYKPSALFTDGEWNNSADQFKATEIISWYYNTVGKDAIVNDRWGSGTQHGFRTPEYSGGIVDTDRPWAECRGLGRSFGLNRNEDLANYLSSEELISHFVKLVAAGGGMTLNVGPSADGKIPMIQQERLLDLGRWLKVNGEAIYSSRPWKERCYQMKPFTMERKDKCIDFDWVRNAPSREMEYDHFKVVWHGTIVPEHTDLYSFTVDVDDNVVVLLNGDTLINYKKDFANGAESNAQGARNYATTSADRKLRKGQEYDLKVIYEENNMEARMKLHWHSKYQRDEAIPAKDGYEGVYTCSKPEVCFTTKGHDLYAAFINPTNSILTLKDMPMPDKDLKITLLGSNSRLTWTYQDGNIVVMLSSLSYEELKNTLGTMVLKLENYLY